MRSRQKTSLDSSKPARRLRGAWVAAGLVAVVLAAVGLLYGREAGQVAGRQQDLEIVRVNLLAQLLRSELRPAIADVQALASGDGFRNYLETGQPEALKTATQRAVFFSLTKPLYDEVRYLDETGQEIIRVNQGGQVMPPDKLTSKASRPFFRQANTLADGMVFISSFDLNFGASRTNATPPRPTLRFAVPVFDSTGRQARRIYIINCRGEDLIAGLQNAATILFKRVRLLNAQGYWLKGANPGEEWGLHTAGSRPPSIHWPAPDPDLWARIQVLCTEGQARYDGGLLTWRRVRPVEFTNAAQGKLPADDTFLIVASAISPDEWGALFTGLRQIMALAAVALTLLTLFCVWLFRRRERLKAMRTLRVP